MSGETRALAEFVAASRFEDLPKAVVHHAKRCVLDHLGVALAGTASIAGQLVAGSLRAQLGHGPCTIVCEPATTSGIHAAFANGTMAYSQMLDDIYAARGLSHPGNHVIPAALAAGEAEAASGAEFLTAVVVGYEVSCRVADAVGASQEAMGFYTGATSPHFGAAAAVANTLRLEPERCCNALSLAGAYASGIRVQGLIQNDVQPIYAGKAASSGVLIGELARVGIQTGCEVFEGSGGYLDVFSTEPDASQLVSGLREQYRIEKVGFKFHAAAGGISPAIEAILSMRGVASIAPERVTAITIRTHHLELTHHNTPDPRNRFAAVQSAQYCVARALLDGELLGNQLTPEKIVDPAVRQLMERVHLELDPVLDATFPELISASVVLAMDDGSSHDATVISARGTPANPADDAELEQKFGTLTRSIIDGERSDAIRDMVWNIDQVSDIRALGRLLRG